MPASFRAAFTCTLVAVALAACTDSDGVTPVPPGTPPGEVATLAIASTTSDRFVSVADARGQTMARGGSGSANERRMTLMPGTYQVMLQDGPGKYQASSQITVQRGQTYVFSMSLADETSPEVVYALSSPDAMK